MDVVHVIKICLILITARDWKYSDGILVHTFDTKHSIDLKHYR